MATRRDFVIAIGASVLAAPRIAFAQSEPAKIARIGWLSGAGPTDPSLAFVRQGMSELGYVEGKSYVIVPRFANDDFTRLPALAEELANERIDVLVTRGAVATFTPAVRSRVPVVFAFSGDPVEAGFAETLSRPGRNMTGITFMAMELSAKRVEVLKELVPKASRIALLSNPEHAGELSEYRVTDDAAGRLGAAITRYTVRNPEQLASAFVVISADKPDAMIVFPDTLTFTRRTEIAEFAARAKIPSIYGWTEYTDSGGLVSYGPAVAENYKTLAVFIDKVLKGTNAGRIPIEQVTKISLTLNLKAARALGLNVPQSIVARADRLIE